MPSTARASSVISRNNYVASRTIFAAAGRLKHKQVVNAVSRLAKRFPQGKRPHLFPPPTPRTNPTSACSPRKPSKPKSPSASAPARGMTARRFALRLLNTVLGENMSSRLFQVVREDRGLAYSIYSSPSSF